MSGYLSVEIWVSRARIHGEPPDIQYFYNLPAHDSNTLCLLPLWLRIGTDMVGKVSTSPIQHPALVSQRQRSAHA